MKREKETPSTGNSVNKKQTGQKTADLEMDNTVPAQEKSPDDMEIFD